eukprot:jgi/Undpi1/13153/HiC_scaffold_8.g02815.m1
MSTETFNSILSTVYTQTCDEARKGLRLQRGVLRDMGYLGPSSAQLDLTTLTTKFFGELMGEGVEPKDVFLAFTVDQGGNVVNACKSLDVDVFSHSVVNNDELKAIQKLQEEFRKIYELIRHNDTR